MFRVADGQCLHDEVQQDLHGLQLVKFYDVGDDSRSPPRMLVRASRTVLAALAAP